MSNNLPPNASLPHFGPLQERARRVIAIEQTIDPNHTLPEVQFALHDKPLTHRHFTTAHFFLQSDQVSFGVCDIVTDSQAQEQWFSAIDIVSSRGNRGLGTASYLGAITRAIREGHSFRTHPKTQTKPVKNLWERLASLGVARVIDDFVLNKDNLYNGYYIVDSAETVQLN